MNVLSKVARPDEAIDDKQTYILEFGAIEVWGVAALSGAEDLQPRVEFTRRDGHPVPEVIIPGSWKDALGVVVIGCRAGRVVFPERMDELEVLQVLDDNPDYPHTPPFSRLTIRLPEQAAKLKELRVCMVGGLIESFPLRLPRLENLIIQSRFASDARVERLRRVLGELPKLRKLDLSNADIGSLSTIKFAAAKKLRELSAAVGSVEDIDYIHSTFRELHSLVVYLERDMDIQGLFERLIRYYPERLPDAVYAGLDPAIGSAVKPYLNKFNLIFTQPQPVRLSDPDPETGAQVVYVTEADIPGVRGLIAENSESEADHQDNDYKLVKVHCDPVAYLKLGDWFVLGHRHWTDDRVELSESTPIPGVAGRYYRTEFLLEKGIEVAVVVSTFFETDEEDTEAVARAIPYSRCIHRRDGGESARWYVRARVEADQGVMVDARAVFDTLSDPADAIPIIGGTDSATLAMVGVKWFTKSYKSRHRRMRRASGCAGDLDSLSDEYVQGMHTIAETTRYDRVREAVIDKLGHRYNYEKYFEEMEASFAWHNSRSENEAVS